MFKKILTIAVCHRSSARKTREMTNMPKMLTLLEDIVSDHPGFNLVIYDFEYATENDLCANPYDIIMYDNRGRVFIYFAGDTRILNMYISRYEYIMYIEKKIAKMYRNAKILPKNYEI